MGQFKGYQCLLIVLRRFLHAAGVLILACTCVAPTATVFLQHISTKGSKSANMKPDAKQFVFHNSPNEAAHIIGPGKTITSKVPSFCVYYTSTKRSFSKNQVAGFLPWTGVCQT